LGVALAKKFNCSMDEYSMLQRLRDNLIVLKVEHRKAEERRQFYLEAGNIEMAKLTSDTVNRVFAEIRASEKEIEKLERYVS
jgi:hypothetical protein